MNVVEATRSYEAWLGEHIPIIRADLAAKHERMADDSFCFLRATFYRWIQLLPELCAAACQAPAVLSVGDLHVENFGTWRDAEGRLIWGINDFDEAAPLPYTNDLVRLATSASLAIEQEDLILPLPVACAAILDGYTTGLEAGGHPFVLSEQHRWLRDIATSKLRDPTLFWEKFTVLPTLKRVPPKVLALLRSALPNQDIPFRVAHRQAGLGSLGRERYVALTEWCGGKIAREAKPLVPSASVWSGLRPHDHRIHYAEILRRSARAADPFLCLHDAWILRRLSPYCSRIELAALPRSREEEKLLWGMGRELANIHIGQRSALPRILEDLRRRKPKWLRQSTEIMTAATLRDWKAWRKRGGRGSS
ncbi:MAG: DUF2252 family protein [Chthoniobacter sp.]